MARTDRIGTVYLLHFERPLRHAQHYLGWALDHEARLRDHLAGKGSRLVAAVVAAGIGVELVRTWEGVDRHFERSLKNGSHRHHCPRCKAAYNARSAEQMRERRELLATVELDREVDGRWIAEVRDCPGALAYGRTRIAAARSAHAIAAQARGGRA